MKTRYSILAVFAMMLFIGACKKTETLGVEDRLFRPVLRTGLQSLDNSVDASWQKIDGANSYKVQLSRDTFKTIDKTVIIDSSRYVFKDLNWEQLYQVQVQAIAADTTKNSKFSNLGGIKTPKFPTIVTVPTLADVTETAIKLRWTNSGDPVTSVKVLLTSNNSEVKQINLTSQNISNQFLDITGLSPSTGYIVYLYSGTRVRGWNNYVTKAPLSGIIIDLRQIDLSVRTQILADTIPVVPNGSTIVLKRGATYNVPNAITLNKSIKIVSGSDLTITTGATIILSGALYNITAGSNIDYLDFEGVIMRGTAAGYMLNLNTACNIGRISFDGCDVGTARGLVRLQVATNSVTNLSFNNCLLSNVLDFGILTVSAATGKVDNVSLTNSTVFLCEKLFVSKQNTINMTISDNTFYQSPIAASYYLDYNLLSITGITSVKNNIFSIGKGTPPATTVNGKRGTMSVTTLNNYATSDFAWGTSSTAFADVITYGKPSTDIFTDPVNGNFKIKDVTFPGRSTAGDPRWRL